MDWAAPGIAAGVPRAMINQEEWVIVLTVRPRASQQTSSRHRVSGEARRRLSRRQQRQLHSETGRGPRCLAVTYAITGDYVLLRLPEYNEVGRCAPGHTVVLDVPDGDHGLEVEGVAQVAGPEQDALVERTRFPEPVPTGAYRVICLPLTGLGPIRRRSWSTWKGLPR